MKNLKRTLKKVGEITCQRIRRDIRYQNLIKTGKLLGSIDFEVVQRGTFWELEFSMVEYGKFLDEGTIYIRARRFFNDIIDDQMKKSEIDILNATARDLFESIEKNI